MVPGLSQEEAALGLALGARRRAAKVPLKQLSIATQLSQSHLSRFLKGERPAAWEAAERIAAEIGMDPADLLRAGRRLPDAVQAALADPDIAHALMGEDYRLPAETGLLLRRASIAQLIERTHAEPGRRELPDPEQLLQARGYRIEREAEVRAPRILVDRLLLRVADGHEASIRFQLAHALGHLELEGSIECDFKRRVDTEADANTFAAYFLVRQRRLEAELAPARRFNLWEEGGVGALVTDVAVRLQVPEWVVAFRLGEGAMLGSAAGVAG